MKTEARAPETPEIVILSDGRDTMLPRPPGLASAILRSARPKQWIKNILVFAAPGAAGVLHHGSVLAHALGAFAVFCVAASGTYLLAGMPWVARPEPASASSPSTCPW